MDDSKDKEGASVSPVHSANKWESASFGDGAQKEKFLRLMGGMKKQHTGRFVIGETIGETSKANTRTDDENKEMVQTLEHQFKIGLEKKLTGQNRRHVGLGFSEPEEEKEQKAKETDEPKGTHTRFKDDGIEPETKGKSGDDGEGEAGSRKSQEKDGKDSGRKDRERDSDKERKRDEPHSSRRDADHRSTDRKRGEEREHHGSHHRSGEDRKHRDNSDGKDRHERRGDRGKRRDEEAKTSRKDEDRKHKRDDRGSKDADDHHRKRRKSSNSD